MLLLDGKIALITGTSRGIGREIAELYAKNGAIVYANARQIGCLDEFVVEMKEKYNAIVIPQYYDIRNEVDAKKAIMQIKKEQGRLDVLVNNAGVMKDALIGMVTYGMMQEIFDVNVFAMMNMIQLAVKIMSRQGSGSIINMSSIVGTNGNKGQLVYSASKGAVISLTKTAAKELASLNIRVNAVAPGIIDTDMLRSVDSTHQAERIEKIGMKRIGTPNDIAKACVFLASDLSEYVTGQILGVDGSALV